MSVENYRWRFAFAKYGDSMLVLPGGNAYKNDDYKITESFLERVKPQTEADSELQLRFVCPALYFANASIEVVIFVLLVVFKLIWSVPITDT